MAGLPALITSVRRAPERERPATHGEAPDRERLTWRLALVTVTGGAVAVTVFAYVLLHLTPGP